MKSATPELIAYLNTAQEFILADLYTFVLAGYTEESAQGVYRYCSFDMPVSHLGNTWLASGAIIERDKVRLVVGVEVDSLSLKIMASPTMEIIDVPFMQACTSNLLDGATVKLERAFLNSDGSVIGVVNMFQGRVAGIQASRSEAQITVNSDLELLNVQMPRHVYQPGCQHTLYDGGCQVDRSSKEVVTTVTSATLTTITTAPLAQSSGYFDMGYVSFVLIGDVGEKRTIRAWDGETLSLLNPLNSVPTTGTTIYLYPGCDKSKETCDSKFNNLVNFRGFPYVPAPETMR